MRLSKLEFKESCTDQSLTGRRTYIIYKIERRLEKHRRQSWTNRRNVGEECVDSIRFSVESRSIREVIPRGTIRRHSTSIGCRSLTSRSGWSCWSACHRLSPFERDIRRAGSVAVWEKSRNVNKGDLVSNERICRSQRRWSCRALGSIESTISVRRFDHSDSDRLTTRECNVDDKWSTDGAEHVQRVSRARRTEEWNRSSVDPIRITWAYCSWICFCSAEINDRSRFNFFTNSMSSSLEDMIHLSKKKEKERNRKPLIVSFLCIIVIRFTQKKEETEEEEEKKTNKQRSEEKREEQERINTNVSIHR